MTPTEDLVMDVLGARARLGEELWTFESRHRRTLERLEEAGYVNVMHGIASGTVRASLTEKGKELVLSPLYTSPLEQRLERTELERDEAVRKMRVALS